MILKFVDAGGVLDVLPFDRVVYVVARGRRRVFEGDLELPGEMAHGERLVDRGQIPGKFVLELVHIQIHVQRHVAGEFLMV